MIAAVTLNPSLDYGMKIESPRLGGTNRAERISLRSGGKGSNVACVLKRLGVDSAAFGLYAGFTGEEAVRMLREEGIVTCPVFLKKGLTRINVKIPGGEGTEFNAPGPEVSAEELEALIALLKAQDGLDGIVLAGSVPAGCGTGVYGTILRELARRDKGNTHAAGDAPEGLPADCGVVGNTRAAGDASSCGQTGRTEKTGRFLSVVDAEGETLLRALPEHPFLIKPNRHELEGLFHRQAEGTEDIVRLCRLLQEKGAVNVLVSMAAEGAILVTEEGKAFRAQAPEVRTESPVGAGDSMVAGFLAGWLRTKDYEAALRSSVAAGSAAAASGRLAEAGMVSCLLSEGIAVETIDG